MRTWGSCGIVDEPQGPTPHVVHEWVAGDDEGAQRTAAALDDYDVVLVQHEYGIFGGPDGQDVLDLVAQVRVPVVTVLHTVLTRPTANQHRVLAELVERSAALITMTATARDRLVAGWGVDPARVTVVPHGAEDNRATSATGWMTSVRPRTVLTWGLLSQGKGIEWVLLALAELRGRAPLPTYRVVGQTHPRVLEHEGEAYRDRLTTAPLSLVLLVAGLGVALIALIIGSLRIGRLRQHNRAERQGAAGLTVWPSASALR